MYSKQQVKSYQRNTTPKRSYKRNIIPPGATELATSLLGGEVMSRAKDWAKGKKSKLARKLHKNPIDDTEMKSINKILSGLTNADYTIKVNFPNIFIQDPEGREWHTDVYSIRDTVNEIETGEILREKDKKKKKSKRNPSSESISPEVEDMSKSWHGRDVGDITEVEETESFETDLVELGDLEELGILELGTISFKKDQPKLCCDSTGHNLEIVSGDQMLDLDSEGVEFKGKRLIPLGYLYSIVYVTDKHHLEGSNGYPEPYEHYFGEEFYKKKLPIEPFGDNTDEWFEELEDMGVVQEAVEKGLLPTCVYDKTDGKILIAGGEYEVTELGIKD